ncbi:MAG: hypothetical protein FD123_1518 [Bacteroidetes bacterium]|nr:MAG: hypothetical protein FD123_1518 [Bacteroidota bacterium]
MKKIILLFFAVLSFPAIQAQNKKFVAAMEKQLAILDTAKTKEHFQQVYNSFERISNAEGKEWLPKYYMAYCSVLMSYMDDVSKADEYCDRADALLLKADSLSPNNSEIYVLRSWATSSRIRVNPMTRGAKFGPESGILLAKAKELDANNPRVYLLDGQGKFYTPPAFGGGKDKAKPVLEEAVKKYETFKPASSISPTWGAAQAKKMLDECNK